MQEALRWRYASIAYRHGVRLRDSDEDEDEEAGAAGWTEEDDEAVTGARRASLTTSLELCRVLIQTCALVDASVVACGQQKRRRRHGGRIRARKRTQRTTASFVRVCSRRFNERAARLRTRVQRTLEFVRLVGRSLTCETTCSAVE